MNEEHEFIDSTIEKLITTQNEILRRMNTRMNRLHNLQRKTLDGISGLDKKFDKMDAKFDHVINHLGAG